MRRALPISRATHRFLLGAFLLYLFGVLGYLSTSHVHADGGPESQSHSSCQLCQVSHQPFVAPEAAVCFAPLEAPVALVEALWAPVLASRHPPFASRAPPSA